MHASCVFHFFRFIKNPVTIEIESMMGRPRYRGILSCFTGFSYLSEKTIHANRTTLKTAYSGVSRGAQQLSH